MDHHKKAVNKFTHNDKFFSAVGRFFFEFSQREATLRDEVAKKIGLDDRYVNSIMTQAKMTPAKVAALAAPAAPAPSLPNFAFVCPRFVLDPPMSTSCEMRSSHGYVLSAGTLAALQRMEQRCHRQRCLQ